MTAFVVRDGVFDTTSSTGTGAITLDATPPSGYRTFGDVCSVNDGVPYRIRHLALNEWEDGIAVYTASNQLTRITVTSSSNAGSAVSFSAGQKEVYLPMLAETAPQKMDFYGATTASNVEIGGRIELVVTDATAASEDFDLRFSTMTNGALGLVATLNGAGLFLPDGLALGVKGASDPNHGIRHSTVIDGLHIQGFGGITFNRGTGSGTLMGTFDSSSRFIVGSQVALGAQQTLHDGGQVTPWMQVVGDAADSSSLGLYRFSNTSTSASFTFTKARGLPGDSPDVQTVQASDALGDISFVGVDPFGTPRLAVFLEARADVAPGGTAPNGWVAGRLLLRIAPQSSGNPEEVLRIDSLKRFVFGGGNSTSAGVSAMSFLGNATQLQNMGIDAATGGMTLAMFNTTAGTCAHLDFYRSKNATVGTADNVANAGDAIGKIVFIGAQQTGTFSNQTAAAQILCELDGTATGGASADMPGRLTFWTTPDGSGTLAEGFRLDNQARIIASQSYGTIANNTVGGTDSKLQIVGNNLATGGISISVFSGSGGSGSAGSGGTGPHLDFYRSLGSTVGTATVLSTAGSTIGALNFWGAQQTGTLATQTFAGQITCELDGTATSGTTVDLPSRFRFSLMPDGLGGTPASTDPVEVLRLTGVGYATGTDSGLFEEVQFSTLNNDFTGSNATGAQPLLSSAADVFTAKATTYAFEGLFILQKSVGTTSHTISFGFGGTATYTNIDFACVVNPNITSLTATSGNAPVFNWIKTNSATVITAATTTATIFTIIRVYGIAIVSGAGTIIPQYTLSAAPGGAYNTARGSFFRIWRLGATARGQWA